MATIYDVARVAGVSPKTVSRVLNGDAPVGQNTRDNVTEAINALGYVPSSAARSLRSNKSGLIGVVSGAVSEAAELPHLAGLPEIFVVKGIQDVIETSGRTLLLADTGGRADRVPDLLRTLVEHRVEGLIYVAPYHQKMSLPAPIGVPMVIANGFDDEETPSVIPDDYTGQRRLVEGLIARGHRRIAYLQLPPQLAATQHRTRAYGDALAARGLDIDPALVVAADIEGEEPEVRSKTLERAIVSVLSQSSPPTAICCGNDRMALAVYGIARVRGLRIPQDISVAGYDDHRMISETLYPALTSVDLPYRAIGRQAARLLMNPRHRGPPVEVSGDVRWRESVSAPHSST